MPGKRSLKTNTSTLWNWPEAELKSLHSRVAAGRAAQLGWAPQCEPRAPAGPRPRGFHSGYRAHIVKHFRGIREYPEGGPWQRSRRRPPSEKGLQIADLPRASPYNFSLCNHDEIQEDLLNGLDPHRTFKNERKDQAAAVGTAHGAGSPAAGSGGAAPRGTAPHGSRSRPCPARPRGRRVAAHWGAGDVYDGVLEAGWQPETATPGAVALTSIPCCCFPPGATTRFSHLRGRALPAGGSAAVRGRPAGRAGGPAAGVLPGEGAGLRAAAVAVAEHPPHRAATLPRLPAATGGCGAGAGAALPCRGEARGSAGSSTAAGGGTLTRVRWQGAAAGEASRGPCDESKARELMAVWRSYINLG
ncbi:uncharacterized protein LOC119141471 [Falco rusticolus]|uniref:uncharacterized protein LOC119141471 n=1 Tax=Falco rusticolus TaxID=120794 RepID=UPI0018867A7A|nr:uncharacterized protein LOC119141471 [Falco rusticolus]